MANQEKRNAHAEARAESVASKGTREEQSLAKYSTPDENGAGQPSRPAFSSQEYNTSESDSDQDATLLKDSLCEEDPALMGCDTRATSMPQPKQVSPELPPAPSNKERIEAMAKDAQLQKLGLDQVSPLPAFPMQKNPGAAQLPKLKGQK